MGAFLESKLEIDGRARLAARIRALPVWQLRDEHNRCMKFAELSG